MVQVYLRVIPLSMEHEIAGLEWPFHPLAFNQEVNEIVYLAPYFKAEETNDQWGQFIIIRKTS